MNKLFCNSISHFTIILQHLCSYYTHENVKKLYKEGKVTQFLKKQAKAFSPKLRHCGLERYVYTQKDGFLAPINAETKFCTCLFFNDKAMCKH